MGRPTAKVAQLLMEVGGMRRSPGNLQESDRNWQESERVLHALLPARGAADLKTKAS